MLIRFVVSNFLSFNEECEFNMLAGSFKTHKHHVYPLGKVDVLKAAEIYGSNGAGKSNFIRSIEIIKEIVTLGGIGESIDDSKFKLRKEHPDNPATFEIEFFVGKIIYSYGIVINNITIIEEWLYESGVTSKDKLIFERKTDTSGKSTITVADKYLQTQKERLLIELMEENLLHSNELFLGKSESLKIQPISHARAWFIFKLQLIFPYTEFENLILPLVTNEKFRTFANQLLASFDTGVSSMGIVTIGFEKFFGEEDEKIKTSIINNLRAKNDPVLFDTDLGKVLATIENENFVVKKMVFFHKNNYLEDIPFELLDESNGTRRLLDLLPMCYDILNTDITYLIDEIDDSLHTALLQKLVQKIMADTTTKGQLIFTTYESNLLDLDIFRQDEIWFAEKDKKGSTHLYSLSDFKPRYDLDIRKGYLKGRFGAIPFLGNLKELNWSEHA